MNERLTTKPTITIVNGVAKPDAPLERFEELELEPESEFDSEVDVDTEPNTPTVAPLSLVAAVEE